MHSDLPSQTTIPAELRDVDQWVCWRTTDRGDKLTKAPINPTTGSFASTTDPSTWASFDDAHRAAKQRAESGIGFVFTAEDRFVGVDLDHCRDADTGRFEPWAAEVIGQLDSYTEVSPSGTGCHVLCTGTIPPGRNRSGDVEMYTEARFFTVTGTHVEGTPTTVNHRTPALGVVASEHLSAAEEAVQEPNDTDDTHTPMLSDEDLLERAMAAANGAKFTRLWNGDTTGYDSHSEADMALCCLLAFWTGNNTTQMNRLFCRSGLHRDKWDTQHFADGSTYGERTIQRACARTDEQYTPHRTQNDELTARTSPQPRAHKSVNPVPDPSTTRRLETTEETLKYLEERVSALEIVCEQLQRELTAERRARAALETQTTAMDSSVLARVGRLFR